MLGQERHGTLVRGDEKLCALYTERKSLLKNGIRIPRVILFNFKKVFLCKLFNTYRIHYNNIYFSSFLYFVSYFQTFDFRVEHFERWKPESTGCHCWWWPGKSPCFHFFSTLTWFPIKRRVCGEANQISIWPKRENSLKGGSSTQERRTIRQKFPFASQAIPGKQKIF